MNKEQKPTAPIVTPDFDGAPCHVCGADGVHLCEQSGVQPSAPQVLTESAWLVESKGSDGFPRYRSMSDADGIYWTPDHMEAIRFARRVDAERFCEGDPETVGVTQHVWQGDPALSRVPAEQPAQGTVTEEEAANLQGLLLREFECYRPTHPAGLCVWAYNALLDNSPHRVGKPAQGTQGVPDSRPIHDQQADEPQVDERCRYFWRTGWNAYRSAMLAAAPKPPAEQPKIDAHELVGLKPMTGERAAYFMHRFKREEKLLGPNEQAAVDYVIAMLEQPSAPSLPPIESEQEMNRFYIPVHPDWEVQTKGNGSTFRIANTKTGDRLIVTDEKLHGPLEQIARDVHAYACAPQQDAQAIRGCYIDSQNGVALCKPGQEKGERLYRIVSQPTPDKEQPN